MSLITVSTLGTVSVQGTLGPELPTRGKLVALLVYLSRGTNGGVRREELAALFWGDKPEALARQSLRHALMRLRRATGEHTLIVSSGDVRVVPGSVELDATRFEQYLAAGDLSAAITLWKGDFLDGFEDAGGEAWHVWLETEREGLRQRRGYALATLVEEAEARGDWELASRLAEQWSTALPLDERAQLRWIQTLRLSGRHMDALAAHARITHRLRDLGIQPSLALVRMGEELARSGQSAPARASGSTALFTPDMIGRTTAFAALVAAWHAVFAQQGAVVLLEGEEGFGKTRLLDEFLRWHHAQQRPALVLRARAFESDRDVPWSAARELLSDLRTAPGLSGAPDSALAELAELVPSLTARFRNLPQPTGGADARARALSQVLGDVAAELPVLLFIDDFTSADAASARLALSIARHPPAGVLVVLAVRTDCIEAAAFENELRSVPACRHLRLEPLSLADVEAVIASMLALNPDVRRTLAERIYSETAGNPLYTVELIAALADEGSLFIGGLGVWEVDQALAHRPLPVPENVRSVARMRTERLGDAPRRVLEAAALLGAHAAIDKVAAVTRLHGDELDSAVGELVVRKLVRSPNGSASIEFVHEIVRRAVCDAISPARRQSYEAALAGLRRPVRRWRTIGVAAALVLFTSVGLFAIWRTSPIELPILAVGEIVDQSGSDSVTVRFPVRDLLATRLATLPSLPVISPERMHELRAQLASSPVAVRTMHAARRAGAKEIVQGTLLRSRTGQLRLELRRVNISTGAVAGAYSVTGGDALALIDAATEAIASGFGIRVQPGQPGMPASLVAYRLYEEGLRTYYQGDGGAAHRFFSAALKEDSTFAMAAFYDYAAKQMGGLLTAQSDTQLARVVRLAEHAPPRESLLIRALWAAHVHAPGRLALAETLAIRYSHDPEGHLLLGQAKYAAGDHLGSIPHYLKVVNMDTLGVRNAVLPCRACDALAGMTAAYSLADSMPAAERSARAWTRLQPSAARAWVYLATAIEYQGRFDEAVSVRRNAMALRPGDRVDLVYPARVHLRRGQHDRADPMFRQRMSEGPVAVAREASWYLIMSLRQQGRLREAIEIAREFNDSLSEAMVRLEMGHARVAAAFFEGQAAHLLVDTVVPRHDARIWRLAHAATARAAAGDTAALKSIADTIAALGVHTAAARNNKLRHYPLGLLYAARGDHHAAVRAFERSVNSLTNGYGRLNLELARSLLAINQPRRAVAVLEAGLRGPLDAGNYYVTHTDFRELLGAAYEAAAMPDSALVMYQRVLSAWNGADAVFDGRRANLQQRLAALTPQNPRSATLVRR